MNKVLIFFISLLVSSCSSGQNETAQPQNSAPASQNEATPQKVRRPIYAQETPQDVSQSQRNVNIATSRPADKIEKKFPYDIDLKKTDGELVNSSKAFKKNGKPTVLLFWLTTCAPCRMEMEAIKGKFENWQKEADFNFYAISTDFPKNYENFVKRVNESGWKWEAYNDVNREFMQVMPGELNGLPQTFLLDKNGEIVLHKRKWVPGDEDKLFQNIKELSPKKG
ncbi:MAG TPA: TlpA disulfide reductase family protein [Saprospiraceae bacterium]|nr:TlpA disulfide reductase family protein [Saprospiraceae bacterium]